MHGFALSFRQGAFSRIWTDQFGNVQTIVRVLEGLDFRGSQVGMPHAHHENVAHVVTVVDGIVENTGIKNHDFAIDPLSGRISHGQSALVVATALFIHPQTKQGFVRLDLAENPIPSKPKHKPSTTVPKTITVPPNYANNNLRFGNDEGQMTRQDKIGKIRMGLNAGLGFHTGKKDFGGGYPALPDGAGRGGKEIHVDLYSE